MIRRGARGLNNLCLYDVFLRDRRGHVVNLLRIRAAVVNASVPRVEARDVGVWQMHIVRVEEFQKTVSPPIALAHNVLAQDIRAISGPRHCSVSTPE